MKVLYVRISSIDQKTDRQRVNEKDYKRVIEDTCSGSIPFFERSGGKEIKKLVEENKLTSLHVWQIDRLGRSLKDILNTIHYFNQKGITIFFESQSLRTITEDGKQNPIANMMIAILGIVSEMERIQIKERQAEGIKIAKQMGKYIGRKEGTKENTLDFLSKPKNKKALELMKKGTKLVEIQRITKVSLNTLTKIKKLSKIEEINTSPHLK